jgi:bla regulator protein blaR1
MSSLFAFLIKAGSITAILYVFYRILLSGSTFHSLNRAFLLFIMPFSLMAPFLGQLNILTHKITSTSLWINDLQEGYINADLIVNSDQAGMSFEVNKVLVIIYFLMVLLLLSRFFLRLAKLFNLKKRSILLSSGKIKIYKSSSINAAFSFFNWIFVPFGFEKTEGFISILEHEKVHSEQWHSLDLVLLEIFSIAFWFNPFVIPLRKSLKSVHEFIADKKIIQSNIPLKEYLGLMISGLQTNVYSGITNQFSSLTLKKRIDMITKNKSSIIHKFSYFLILPFLFFILQAFSVVAQDNVPSVRPVKGGEITLHYGFKGKNPITNKQFTHQGTDFRSPKGTDVYTASNGEVIEADENEAYGKFIIIKHDDVFETLYAHLNDFSVKKGDNVSSGQVIAHIGNTGYSTGPHLHYEVRKNGERVDPEEYFK